MNEKKVEIISFIYFRYLLEFDFELFNMRYLKKKRKKKDRISTAEKIKNNEVKKLKIKIRKKERKSDKEF